MLKIRYLLAVNLFFLGLTAAASDSQTAEIDKKKQKLNTGISLLEQEKNNIDIYKAYFPSY